METSTPKYRSWSRTLKATSRRALEQERSSSVGFCVCCRVFLMRLADGGCIRVWVELGAPKCVGIYNTYPRRTRCTGRRGAACGWGRKPRCCGGRGTWGWAGRWCCPARDRNMSRSVGPDRAGAPRCGRFVGEERWIGCVLLCVCVPLPFPCPYRNDRPRAPSVRMRAKSASPTRGSPKL